MIKKKLIATILLFTIANLYSQNVGSPYSSFGIGEIKLPTTVASQSMQNLSVYPDSLQVNLVNPASYANLKLVNFTAGGTFSNLKTNLQDKSESFNFFNFNYLGFGSKVSKRVGIGFGIVPYSRVSYSYLVEDENEDLKTSKYTLGKGGINRVYASIGYRVTKNFSFGGTFHYNFGQISTSSLENYTNIQLTYEKTNSSTISGTSYTLAVNYNGKISNEYRINASVVTSPKFNVYSENISINSTIGTVNNTSRFFDRDTVALGLLANSKTSLPTNITVGVGIGKQNKWFLGGEYRLTQNSQFSIGFPQSSSENYSDVTSYAVGGFYIPKYNSYDKILKRIIYRGGIQFGNSNVATESKKIPIFGVSTGIGIPIKSFSKLNIGLEYLQRKPSERNFITESYFNIKIGLSFNDIWFIKRKYN